MNKTFIEVQQATLSALHQKPYHHDISNPKDFYHMTMENGLSGLVFSILDKSKTHPILYERLERNNYDYISRDIKQIEAIKDIDDLLNKAQIDHLFMKGSILKSFYPETYMRAMGDIDILIKEASLSDVHELFNNHNIICTSRSKQHDVFEMPNKVVIEVHPTLYKPFNEEYQLMEDVWEHVHLEESYRYRMNKEFELVYLLYHLAKHIESGGIGLRSVLDIGMYLLKMEHELNRVLLSNMLNDMKLTNFFQTITDVLAKCFHIYSKINPSVLIKEEVYEKFINYLTTSGIHGIGRHNNIMAPRMVSYKRHQKSKFKLIIDIIFPDTQTMIGMYPWLKKSMILLPFAWVKRWFKIMIRRPHQSIKKVKQLKLSSQAIEDQAKLFEEIGL